MTTARPNYLFMAQPDKEATIDFAAAEGSAGVTVKLEISDGQLYIKATAATDDAPILCDELYDLPEIEEGATVEEVSPSFEPSDFHPHDVTPHFEHGQWWLTCNCGASWSAQDAEKNGETFIDWEEISDGVEDYHQQEAVDDE